MVCNDGVSFVSDGVRNATRGSPCYSEDDDVPATRLSVVDSGRFKDRSEGYRERREIKGGLYYCWVISVLWCLTSVCCGSFMC